MNEYDTIIRALKESKRLAVVLPEDLSLDALCAGLALQATMAESAEAIESRANKATLFSSTKIIPTTPFLSPQPTVKNSFSEGNQLVIKVSNRSAQPKEIRYEKDSDGLSIFVTADSGEFKESDVSILPNLTTFDLVVVLGATNLELLGSLYAKNTKLFFEIPTINIDVSPSNEYFSKLNLVVPTASSLSEVIYDVIEKLSETELGAKQSVTTEVLKNNYITTSLLAGIIFETSSFRDPKTTPATLQKASVLVANGARQQEIIQYLFKTKTLQQLQVWGRALARLVEYPEKQAITATLTKNDLEKTHSSVESLPTVLKDLIEMITGYSLVVLVAENAQVLIAGLPHENIFEFAKNVLGDGIVAKPVHLLGKYEYIAIETGLPLIDLQTKVDQLIKGRKNVV